MRLTLRRILVAAAVPLAIAVAGSATAYPYRPSITGFYAKDEGARIHLKVNFCGSSTARRTDSYSVVFRVWDETSGSPVKIVDRRVSGRPMARCSYGTLTIPDDWPSGLYSANAAVVDRTQGGFIRISARYFRVS